MPRNITLTFDDGSQHVYNGVPDDVTPEAVLAKAGGEFKGRGITNIDGGRPPVYDAYPERAAVREATAAAPLDNSRTYGEMASDIGQSVRSGIGGLASMAGTAMDNPLAATGALATSIADTAVTGPVRLASQINKWAGGDGSLPMGMDRGAADIHALFDPAYQKYGSDLAESRQAADKAGSASSVMRGVGDLIQETATDAKSKGAKANAANYDKTQGFGALKYLASNPGYLADMVAENLPQQLPMLAVGRVGGLLAQRIASTAGEAAYQSAVRSATTMPVVRDALAAGDASMKSWVAEQATAAAKQAAEASMAKATPYLTALGMGSEGLTTSAQTADSIHKGVEKADESELLKLPAYQDYLAQTKDPKAARGMLAGRLSAEWAPLAGMGTVAGSLLTGGARAEAEALSGQVTGFKAAGKNTLKEMAEEAAQNPLEDAAQYGATSQVDPNAKLDPIKASVEGALVSLGHSGPIQLAGPTRAALTRSAATAPAPAAAAPKVEDQPTIPVAPVVAKPNAAQTVTQQILAAEGGTTAQADTVPAAPSAAMPVQPAGSDTTGQPGNQSQPVTADALSKPGSVIPDTTSVQQRLADIASRLAESRARQEEAGRAEPEQAKAPANAPTPTPPVVPVPGQAEAIVAKALEQGAKHSDLKNEQQYTDQALERIGSAPQAGPELQRAVQAEQQRRAAEAQAKGEKSKADFAAARSGDSADISTWRDGARPLSVERGLELARESRNRALLPQEKGYMDALRQEIGTQAFDLIQREGARPYAVRADERKFELPRIIERNKAAMAEWDSGPKKVQNADYGTNTGTTSAGLAGPQGATSTANGRGPAPNVQQERGNTSGVPTGTPTFSNQQTAGSKPGQLNLKLADPVPRQVVDIQRPKVRADKGVEFKVSTKPLSTEQQLVSAMARSMGKNLSWIERTAGDQQDMPDGFVTSYGGKYILMDVNSSKPLLEVLLHEGTHALPQHIRAKLLDFVLPRVSAEGRAEFLRRYDYANQDPRVQNEEVLAYVAQQIARKPEFIQDLKTALGNKDFAELARVLIGKMKEWLGEGDSQFDKDFLGKHVSELQEVHNELVAAYTQAMQEQGLTPDASVTEGGPAYAKKPGSDVGHKREASSGRYVGAPDWVGASPQQLTVLRTKLRQLAQEGESGRFWYEKSSKAVLDLVGGDKVDAEKFVGLLAIYSQGTEVNINLGFALEAYYQWKAGLPVDTGRFPTAQGKKAKAWLEDGKDWGGIKTNNFYADLMEEIDPSKFDEGHATMDMWVALAFDYGMKVLDQGPKYNFAKRETARLAEELGWKPHQVQAAIWTAIKARVETSEKDRNAAEITRGIATKNGGAHSVVKGREYDHFRVAHEFGMKSAITKEEIAARGVDFADALTQRAVQMSWEATPSVTGGDLPGIHTAPTDQKMEYLEAIAKVLAPDGRDLIAEMINLHSPPTVFGFSAWESAIGAGAQSFFPVPITGAGKDRAVLPVARDLLGLYSAIKGLVLKQDAVVWHTPVWDDAKARQNGVHIATERGASEAEMQQLYSALHDHFGTWELAPGWRPDGVRVLNFVDGLSNKDFQKGVDAVIASIPEGFGGKINGHAGFRSDGEYIGNSWQEAPNGEEYKVRIEQGRPNLLGRVADLRSRVEAVNREFGEKYDWGNPGTIAFSNKEDRGPGRTDDLGDRSGSAADNGDAPRYGKPINGSVSATGYHFSKQPRATLNGNYYGTGLKGLEAQRLDGPENADIRPRVFFYVDSGKGVRPEDGVGGNGHRVQLDNLYDAGKDPLEVIKGVRGQPGNKSNNWERAVKEAGYDGYLYIDPLMSQGFAVLIGAKHSAVPVQAYSPTGYSAPAAIPQPYKRGLSSKELNTIDVAAVQAVAPSAKLRAGTFQVDEAELPVARAELAKQGITLPETGPVFSNKAQDLDQDITLEIPLDNGKTAKMTVNAQTYINQLDARKSALEMVKECMA